MTPSLKNGTWAYPAFIICYFTSVDILPMMFQMLSVKIVTDHYNRSLSLLKSPNILTNFTEIHESAPYNPSFVKSSKTDKNASFALYNDNSLKDSLLIETLSDHSNSALTYSIKS